jgi:hypothetical protein
MDDDCCICLDSGGDAITRCKHVFHRECLGRLLRGSGQQQAAAAAVAPSASCPLCRAPVLESELLVATPTAAAAADGGGDPG